MRGRHAGRDVRDAEDANGGVSFAIRQIKSASGHKADQARDRARARHPAAAADGRAQRHAPDPGHDLQGPPPGRGGGARARRANDMQHRKSASRRGRDARRASAAARARRPGSAAPPARVTRARRRAPAARSRRGSKAARCRSSAACRSAGSRIPGRVEYQVVNGRPARGGGRRARRWIARGSSSSGIVRRPGPIKLLAGGDAARWR